MGLPSYLTDTLDLLKVIEGLTSPPGYILVATRASLIRRALRSFWDFYENRIVITGKHVHFLQHCWNIYFFFLMGPLTFRWGHIVPHRMPTCIRGSGKEPYFQMTARLWYGPLPHSFMGGGTSTMCLSSGRVPLGSFPTS